MHVASTVLSYIGMAITAMFDEEVKEDLDRIKWNPFNADENTVLKSKKVSFYKGAPIIRHDIPGSTSCQIFGIIFLNKSEHIWNAGESALRHEWGHGIQELMLGVSYLTRIAIPSLITFLSSSLSDKDYYSLPWERTADFFGNVYREFDYKEGSLNWAIAENFLGVLIIPFYLLFGF